VVVVEVEQNLEIIVEVMEVQVVEVVLFIQQVLHQEV
jgi:hypothetical protein